MRIFDVQNEIVENYLIVFQTALVHFDITKKYF